MNNDPSIDYALIFHHAPVGLCVSKRRVIHTANPSLAAMFGYTPSQLADQSFQILYPTVEEFERTGLRIVPIMSERGSYSDERIMKRANDELFWCRVSGRGLVDDDPHAAGIWTFEDLSEKRKVTTSLTPREREIAALLIEGKTSKVIAPQIGMSPRTVEMHRAKLMKKFSATTSGELVHQLLGTPPPENDMSLHAIYE
jgi:PAS domain S-box-containing protein